MKQTKRVISFVLVLTMIVAMFSMNFTMASAAESAPLLGDVNRSSTVTILDASLIQKSVAKLPGSTNYSALPADDIEVQIADVNHSKTVTILDASIIQKWVAKDAVIRDQYPGIAKPLGDPVIPTDGYYVIGKINGVENWETYSESNKLEANPGSEGEYMIDMTFVDGDAIKVVKVEEGVITTWYKDGLENEYVLTDEGGKTGDCTVYFRPDGNDEWSYTYLTVVKKAEPATEPDVTEPEEIADGYYVIGKINGVENWETVTASYQLAENPAAEGEYLVDMTFVDGDGIKAVKVENGEITEWFKPGMENEYKLTDEGGKTGECTVYFRPEGNDDWSYTYLTVQKKSSEPSTEEPGTEPTGDVTDGYYIVGVIGGAEDWATIKPENKLAENAAAEGEYMIDMTFVDGDAIKAVKVENGAITTWYKPGMGTEYKLTDDGGKTGECTVYFRPEGNADWSYTYLTVQKKSSDASEEPGTEPENPSEVKLEDGYYVIGIIGGEKNWNTPAAENKLAANATVEGEYSLDKTFVDGDAIKVVEVKDGEIVKWFKDGMTNEYKLTDEGGKTGECTVYFRPEGNSEWSYTYLTVVKKSAEPSTEEPATEPAGDAADGYYVIGKIGGVENWETVTPAYKLAANEAAEGEYSVDITFADGDAIKVVEVKDGAIAAWYKDGLDNEYQLTEAGGKTGDCTVYFRPEGNFPTWSYNFFTVVKKEIPTEPETVAPPMNVEDGYYLIGKIDGVENWDSVSADNKLAANADAEGEYTLDKTFADGDYIKVVEVKNNELVNWYQDGMGESTLYQLTEEGGKTGDCTVYFRPEGNPEWSYTYLTVIKKAEPVPTEPDPLAIEDGYYLISNAIDWDIYKLTAEDKLSENPDAEGEYFLDRTFKDGDAIKVIKIVKAAGGVVTTWYKDGFDSEYKLTDEGGKTGDCTVYFRPEGNPDWSYTYLTVIKKAEPATEAEPVELEDGYYIVGIIDGVENWNEPLAENKLAANEAAEGEYFLDKTFADGDSIKAVKVENGAITAWYKDGMDADSEYHLTEAGGKTGECTVYFRPAGNADWSYKYLTVVKKVEPTEAPETQAPIEDGYYVIGIIGGEKNWDSVSAENKLVANPEAEGEYSIEMTFANEDAIKVVEVKDSAIVKWFNDAPNGQYVLTDEGGKTGECTVYFRPEGNSDWSYFWFTVIKKEIPATEPETEAPIVIDVEDGYYLMGIIGGEENWVVPEAENELKINPDAEGEFYLDKTFADGDSIKVVAVKNNEITDWFAPGYGNTYDLTEEGGKTGDCTVYFRPDGETEWSYKYLTVIKKTEPVTEPAPELQITEDGFYLISNAIDWDIYQLTAEDKLAANEDVEAEYFIERTFADGDAIKVVHIANVASGAPVTTWYKDGFDSEYKLTDEGGKTGDCTVYFRPAGNYPDWSYTYLTVIKKEAPATEPETTDVTEAEEVVEYYLVGIINGEENWETPVAENKLLESRTTEGEYFIEKTFKDGDAIKVAKAVNGVFTEYYKEGYDTEYKLTDAGNKTGDCTVYFRPEGNVDWSYIYFTVIKKAESVTLPTGYYLIGNYYDWKISNLTAADMLVKSEDVEGEYTIEKIFKDGDAIKVVYINGDEEPVYFKPGRDNEYQLTDAGNKTGECTVYFRPEGSDEWSYTYLTVVKKEVPVEYRLEDGYYLIGSFCDWEVKNLTAAEKLAANPEAEGEYSLVYTFAAGDGIKVVEIKNDEAVNYFKKGYGNDYQITEDSGKVGEHTLYFRPEGNPDWSYTYLTVIGDVVPETEPATEPETEPAVIADEDTITVYFTNAQNWDAVKAYYFISESKLNAQEEAPALTGSIPALVEWPGVDMVYASTNAKGQKTYSAVVPADADLIIFSNGSGEQTIDIETFRDGEAFVPTQKIDSGKWLVSSYDYAEGMIELDDGYYIIGSFYNWSKSALRAKDMLTATDVEGEYTIRREFKDGDSVKVVEIKNNEIVKWFKDGVGVDYEYVLTDEGGKTGLCDLYFRPAGNPDWSYTYLTVQKYVEPTEPPTEATEPAVTYSTIYFTDNKEWGEVYIHCWTAKGDVTEWPGAKMEFAFVNGEGENVFKYELPSNAIGMVFTNGKSGDALKQTVDATVAEETNAWYISGKDNAGKYTLGTWTAVPPTEAPSTEAPTEKIFADGYYVIGSYADWKLENLTDADLLAETNVKGLYSVVKTFRDGDMIKVVKVEGNKIVKWFKEGMDNEYVLTDEGNKTGECTVYFRPEGNSEWSYNYIRVLKNTPAEPSTEPADDDDTNQIFVTNNMGWNKMYIYYWKDEQSNDDSSLTGAVAYPAWPGVEMEYYTTNDLLQDVYTFDLPVEATGVIFNNGDNNNMKQTVDLTVAEGSFVQYDSASGTTTTSNAVWLKENQGKIEAGGYYDVDTQPASEPASEAPTSAPTEAATEQYVYTFSMTVATKFSTIDYGVTYNDSIYDFVSADYEWVTKLIDEEDGSVSYTDAVVHDANDPRSPLYGEVCVNTARSDDNVNFKNGKKLVTLTLSCAAGTTPELPVMNIVRVADSAIAANNDGTTLPFAWSYSFTKVGESTPVASASGSYEGGVLPTAGMFIPAV
jgi:hypothetical protein